MLGSGSLCRNISRPQCQERRHATKTAVSVTFTLDSSDAGPRYEIADCDGVISYDGSPDQRFDGWNAEDIGTPEPNGANFTLMVTDSSYDLGNQTGIANWALTFIPRGSTTELSPFGNNLNTISGSGGSNSNGTFTLDTGNVKIKNAGDWDWGLMVQMTMPDGITIKCFSSDPEMEVGP